MAVPSRGHAFPVLRARCRADLGYATWSVFRRWRPASSGADPAALGPIIAIFVLALVAHPLLDLFTVYGTQLLAPFSDARFGIPGVPIIDPHYTVILLVAVIAGLWRRRSGVP